jgi:hypothetical protein
MAATIFIEQQTGTRTRHLHHHNGYSSGFSPPRSSAPQARSRANQLDIARGGAATSGTGGETHAHHSA